MTHEVRMPVLSQSMIQGRVAEWLFHEGDRVEKGAPLVLVESDKATHELEAPCGGILSKILADVGTDVDVEAPIAIIVEDAESGAALAASVQLEPAAQAATADHAVPREAGRRSASPLAKRVARELGIDTARVRGTGMSGMVTEKDVRLYAAQQSAPVPVLSSVSIPVTDPRPAPTRPPVITSEDDEQVIPFVGQRARIAERMALSRRTAADVTTVMDVDMWHVTALHSVTGLSYTAYVVRAAAVALREFPVLNAWVAEDRITLKRPVHMGVAVAIEKALVVPVIRNADRKSVSQIDQEITGLGARARLGELTPDDLKGSTFTVTNSGVFGSLMFTPIINLPEVAILGMGKIADTPVVRKGHIEVAPVMYLCLSYDHRAVDGAAAVQFLASVKRHLEQPE